jgi:hypothetical protein
LFIFPIIMYVLYFLSQNYTIYTIEITFTIDKKLWWSRYNKINWNMQ